MYQDHKVVIVVLATQQKYLQVLLSQIATYKIVDECHLVVNTEDAQEISYMTTYCNANDWCSMEQLPVGGTASSCYVNLCDPDTVYLKMDESIVAVDTAEHLADFIDFRINNPGYFVVIANIINNALVSHLQQKAGVLGLDAGTAGFHHADLVGNKSNEFAAYVHQEVLAAKRDLSRFHLPSRHILFHYDQMSLTAFSWLGNEFAKFGGRVPPDADGWLSTVKPSELKRPNVIYDKYAVVLYSSPYQNLDDDILNQYVSHRCNVHSREKAGSRRRRCICQRIRLSA